MQTEQTKQAAREEASAVGGTVKEQARNVAQEASQQARSTLHKVRDDARSRADEQASKIADTLHQTSRQLRSVESSGDGFVASLAQEGASAADRLALRLEQGGVEAVMGDIRSFARRSPGTFLFGAGLAGFAVARIVSGLTSEAGNSGPSNSSYGAYGAGDYTNAYGASAPYGGAVQ